MWLLDGLGWFWLLGSAWFRLAVVMVTRWKADLRKQKVDQADARYGAFEPHGGYRGKDTDCTASW